MDAEKVATLNYRFVKMLTQGVPLDKQQLYEVAELMTDLNKGLTPSKGPLQTKAEALIQAVNDYRAELERFVNVLRIENE